MLRPGARRFQTGIVFPDECANAWQRIVRADVRIRMPTTNCLRRGIERKERRVIGRLVLHALILRATPCFSIASSVSAIRGRQQADVLIRTVLETAKITGSMLWSIEVLMHI